MFKWVFGIHTDPQVGAGGFISLCLLPILNWVLIELNPVIDNHDHTHFEENEEKEV